MRLGVGVPDSDSVVVWYVPKALLPEGNGRDVHPRIQVNGGAVCIERAPCVSVWLSAERGGVGETWMSPSRRMLSSQKFPGGVVRGVVVCDVVFFLCEPVCVGGSCFFTGHASDNRHGVLALHFLNP